MKMILRTWLMGVMCVGALSTAAIADTLDDIRKNGVIRVATVMGVPQFAYLDENLEPVGSDVETMKLIAADLGVKLKIVEVTAPGRVPALQTGKTDLVVSSFGISDERKKAVDFSVPYAILSLVVAGTKNIHVSNYEDLTGKTIALTRATTNDQDITAKTKGANIIRFEDDAILLTSAVTGQADLISTQGAIVNGINQKRPNDPFEIKFVQKDTPLGIGIAKGQTSLKEWVDNWVKTNVANQRLRDIYKKYHRLELPEDIVNR